jgi:hypothetical protein
MNLIESLLLLAVSVGLLRGRPMGRCVVPIRTFRGDAALHHWLSFI